jgi:hypothetical protein
MIEKNMTLRRTNKALFIMALLLCLLVVLLGCTKSKPQVSKPQVYGPCEIIGNLPSEVTKPIEVNYGDKIKLLGVSWNKVRGDQLEISYYWQLIDNPGEFREVFVHFTDANDTALFQNDHTFCLKQGLDNLKGKLVKQTNIVNVPQSVKGKDIDVKMGLYDVHKPPYPRLAIKLSKGALMDQKSNRAVANTIKFD